MFTLPCFILLCLNRTRDQQNIHPINPTNDIGVRAFRRNCVYKKNRGSNSLQTNENSFSRTISMALNTFIGLNDSIKYTSWFQCHANKYSSLHNFRTLATSWIPNFLKRYRTSSVTEFKEYLELKRRVLNEKTCDILKVLLISSKRRMYILLRFVSGL